MKIFVVLLAFTVTGLAVPSSKLFTFIEDFYGKEGRIISGVPANLGAFPWQALIYINVPSGLSLCGGALISKEWILTAAHCTISAKSFVIELGTIKSAIGTGQTFTSTKYIRHEGYNTFLNNDLAVIKLNRPVSFNKYIQPIRLPSRGKVIGAGVNVTVSGFGRTSDQSPVASPVLNYVSLKTINNTECAAVYGSQAIISSTLCAKGHPEHSTCNGDSGGPLVQYDHTGTATHVGIVSFVYINGCAVGKPSGYVRTESYLDWIAKKTGVTSGGTSGASALVFTIYPKIWIFTFGLIIILTSIKS